MIKKDLIKIETVDNELFPFIADLFRRIEKKHPDYLEVVEVDENNQTILFMSSSYVGANVSRIMMEEQDLSNDQKEDFVKVERLPFWR